MRRKESISRETTGKMKYAQYLKKLTYEKLETGGGGGMAITMKVDGENTPAKQKTTRKIKKEGILNEKKRECEMKKKKRRNAK